MKLAIVKYNAGNIQSVIYALNRMGIDPIITDNVDELRSADKVLFPGVGEASSAMNYLRKAGLDQIIPDLKQPVLGICIGLQLMCDYSEEGNTDCLGIFPLKVTKFPEGRDTNGDLIKVPHMGWNKIKDSSGPLFNNIDEDHAYVYYVHSYHAELGDHTIAKSEYILDYTAALHRDNFYAVQFHPEKSGVVGEQILKNFIAL